MIIFTHADACVNYKTFRMKKEVTDTGHTRWVAEIDTEQELSEIKRNERAGLFRAYGTARSGRQYFTWVPKSQCIDDGEEWVGDTKVKRYRLVCR